MILHKFFYLIFTFYMLLSCNPKANKESGIKPVSIEYDMRQDLNPPRMTIAMWDFSWLYMHYPGGAFEDFDKSLDELKERGFNTVRIDAFPLIIGMLDNENEQVTIKGDPLRNWGQTDIDRQHFIVKEWLEFMELAKEKGLFVIISTWNFDCLEYPEISAKTGTDKRRYWQAWEKTLNILKRENLLDHVVYVDLDQEFPYFSPAASELNLLGKIQEPGLSAMEQAGRVKNFKWNQAQMNFVKNYLDSSLKHFQSLYPELRFTFSFTSFWEEIRSLGIQSFDVIELHFWLTQMERFNNRSGFDNIIKDRGEHDYEEYMHRLEATMQSVRPMLIMEMHNRLQFAKDWSDEIAAPLTTTEAWGPWWHMDRPDLSWQWLYDWCEQSMDMASEYHFWGATPWNYSHPYWQNWQNVEWYKKVNNRFLNK